MHRSLAARPLGARAPSRDLARGVRRTLFAVCVSASALAGAGSARAQAGSAPFALHWSAPAGCPTEEDVGSRVTHLLGATSRARAQVDARGDVTIDGAEYRAKLVVAAGDGVPSERTVAGGSCDAVADAAALIVALAVDPTASAPPPPSRETTREAEPPFVEVRSAPPRRWIYVAPLVALDSALLPDVAVGPSLAIGVRPRHLALEVAGAWLPPNHATLPAKPSEGASEQLFTIAATGCYGVLDRSFDFGPCASVGAAWLVADGFGAADTTGTSGQFVFGELAGRALVALGDRLALRLQLGAVVPFARPTVLIENGGTVSHTSAASLRAVVGGEVRF